MPVRPRLAALAPAVAVGVALAAAAPAQAVNCPDFKNAVNTATAGAGATLDGSTHSGTPILTGSPDSGKQMHVTIKNLTFENGTAAANRSGGAIHLGNE